MEEWKKTILLSIRQDIAEINSLQAKISEIYPNNKITSWIYPTKTCTKTQQENFDDKYSSHLELLLDRSPMISHKVYYSSNKTPSNSKHKNVSKPPNLSLARCFQNVWNKISQSKEIIRNNTETNAENTHCRNETCKTCHVAFQTIKEIANYLEENLNDSTTKLTKELLRLKLVDASDESCMGKLCEAIRQDVFSLLAKNAGLCVDNRKYAEKFDNMRNSEESFIKTIKDKDNEILDLMDSLKTIHIKYEEENKEKTSLLSTLDLCMSVNLDLENKNFHSKCEIDEYKICEVVNRRERESLKEEYSKVKEELSCVKQYYCSQIKIVMDFIEQQQGKLEEFKELYGKSQIECGNFVELYLKKITEIEEFVKDIVKNQICSNNTIKNTNKNNEELVFRGNPLDDMVKQMKINEDNIKRLEDENCRLRKTVDKLRFMHGKLID